MIDILIEDLVLLDDRSYTVKLVEPVGIQVLGNWLAEGYSVFTGRQHRLHPFSGSVRARYDGRGNCYFIKKLSDKLGACPIFSGNQASPLVIRTLAKWEENVRECIIESDLIDLNSFKKFIDGLKKDKADLACVD